MNAVDYRQGYFSGSVHDYFAEQSNGKFSLSFDVVGPVKLSRPMGYYGENSLMGDRHVGEMVAEAIQLADDSVDYSQYDWDGDGTVDQVVVIYAGYGEAMGAAEETIWPQEHTLTKSDFGRKLHLDGVILDTYACTCELLGNENSFDGQKVITGIGPMCHEFSHCLGLPDFYDSIDPDHFTTGNWDVMDEGCYNNAEYCPAGYTAYEKWLCGWQEPIVLDKPMTVSDMKALSQGGDFYVVYNDQYNKKTNEFYILENRQYSGFDYFLPGHGVLITHVNYVASDWRSNSVNATYGKEGYAVVPANNRRVYTDSIQAGQTYPYIDNDSLTDTSTPNAAVFNVNKNFKNILQKPITKISVDNNGVASFQFMGGSSTEGVSTTVYDNRKECEYYDLTGRRVGKDYKGLIIEKQNDGTVKKHFSL
jgi:M6 family metalloprotease-like protein